MTTSRLQGIVERFYGFAAAWEPLAIECLGKWYSGREKLPLLRNDLSQLGLSEQRISLLPLAEPLPEWKSLPGVLGSLYVMEGSTLGGQVIARHLRSILNSEAGFSYFHPYGECTGSRWREVQVLLASHSSPDVDPLIVDAANRTFQSIHRWLLPSPLGVPGAPVP